jgi:hypothetical protein
LNRFSGSVDANEMALLSKGEPAPLMAVDRSWYRTKGCEARVAPAANPKWAGSTALNV